ncbi:RDD family protein [Mycobacterium shigaense]|uniref:RDD family protein n=1 Tax=Mycobacterium shigaense TaxID=722731 RepID=UPI002ADFD3AD|nr:RDD family protein [Mycobacterium shigaense]MEA1120833.1 RDD family protein [Mycobacterium shigaense]
MTDQPPPGGPHPPSDPAFSGGYEPPAGGYEPPPPPPPLPGGGSYPPPPPPAGGYVPPPPGPAIRALPTEAYTPWLTRVLAALIDNIPIAVVYGIAWVIALLTQQSSCVANVSQYDVSQYCYATDSVIGLFTKGLAWLVVLAYGIWNFGYRQGTTGSSLGKSVVKIKVISENTGQPIGFGLSIVRQLAHIVDAIICYIGFLFPLWDAKRQTLADKIMTTVVLPIA